jgi:hypothetical protein
VLPLPTAHGKALCRAKMRRAPFAVRPGRIRANPVVYQSMNSHLRYSAASIVSVNCKKCMCVMHITIFRAIFLQYLKGLFVKLKRENKY